MAHSKPVLPFSGAEVRAFVHYQGLGDGLYELTNLHSISVSAHEAVGQARALGMRGIKGTASGVATIAGNMIFHQTSEHPMKGLIERYLDYLRLNYGRLPEWSMDWYRNGAGSAYSPTDFTNRLMTRLPPFNVLLTYTPELLAARGTNGGGVVGPLSLKEVSQLRGAEMISGVRFVTEAKTMSADDGLIQIATEFIAQDYKPFVMYSAGQLSTAGVVMNEDNIFGADDALFLRLFGSRS